MKLDVLLHALISAYNNIMKDPFLLPHWSVTGITFLIYKGQDTKDPRNYRPITCLPTMFKILKINCFK